MASLPPFLAPERWTNKDLYLYHGTLDLFAGSIRKGILVDRGSPDADFGAGFYTTTVKRQARSWAWQRTLNYNNSRAASGREAKPVVVSFQIHRDDLARLDCLAFVRGDFQADDFWSLVHFCRAGGRGHQRHTYPELGSWYDIVAGPVAAVWRTRLAIADTDQYSFHTKTGADLLDASLKRIEIVRLR